MCYCTSAETGGFIPHTQIERFSGGPKKKQKVAALVREQVWLVVEGGYMLNPDLWTEKRNLSDQVEKKKEADRKRIAAKREAERAGRENGDMSRDSRATCRATSDATSRATRSSDSRTVDRRREDLSTVDVVSHPPRRNARPRDDDDDLTSAAINAFLERTECVITADDARSIVAKVLARAPAGTRVIHPARYVAAAIANESDPYALLGDPPLLTEILPQPAQKPFTARPDWCGDRLCDRLTRRREHPETGNDAGPCPECSGNLPDRRAS